MNEITEVGAIFNAAPPTIADGNRTELQSDSKGSIRMVMAVPGSASNVGSGGVTVDSITSPANSLWTGAFQLLFNGASWDRARAANVFKVINGVALTAATDTTIWTPAASKKFRLMGFMFSYSVASRILLKDNTAGTVIRVLSTGVGVWIANAPGEGNGTLSAAANNVLSINAVNAGTLDGYVFGTEE